MSKTQAPKTSPAKAPKAPAMVACLAQGFRPTSGARLYAHTLVCLDLLGISQDKAAPRKALTEAMGPTAVAYHIKHGNMVHTADGVKLTPQGDMRFDANRTIDPEAYAGFHATFTTGAPDGVIVKSATAVKALAQ